MFGIGGGELIFILFIVLMLFGSDKVPDIARTLGKTMAQFKNATEDIKSEIHKGMKENGLDESLTKITGNIQAEIGRAKENLLGDAPKQLNDIKENIIGDTNEQVARTQAEIDDITGPIKRQI